MWWGAFVGTLASGLGSDTWIGLISPGFTMLILLGGTGMPVAELESIKRYGRGKAADKFWEYREQTSPLVTLPPCLYKALPGLVKALCCCEFGCYGRRGADTANPLATESGADYASAAPTTEAKGEDV